MCETIDNRNGQWWWADEVWQWHGPCSSLESAQKRQELYAGDLEGRYNFVLSRDWVARKNREKEGTVHPCNTPEPWNCDCAGSCSCHWEIE